MIDFFGKPCGDLVRRISIMKAAENGDLERVKELVGKNPALVNAQGRNDETPLFRALSSGNLEVVKFLLSQDANVNACNDTRYTPLHRAVMLGNEAMVNLLLEHGADVQAIGMVGRNPLHCASSVCNTSMMALLIERGAAVNAYDDSGLSPLHLAVLGKAEAVRLLLSKGADVNAKQGETNMTPLAYLVNRGRGNMEYQKIIDDLYEHGAVT